MGDFVARGFCHGIFRRWEILSGAFVTGDFVMGDFVVDPVVI